MYNRHLLMCRPDHFRIAYQINPYMHTNIQPDSTELQTEYEAILEAHTVAGHTISFVEPDPAQPDMTYTANVALIRGKKAVLGNLPPERAGELPHAKRWLEAAGYEVVECPYLFSGQGDALPTGTGAVIKGRGWRSDPRSDGFVRKFLGYEIIPIQTISPEWYDDDLVFSIIAPGLIAVCWEALDKPSQKLLRSRSDLDFIDVGLNEAKNFACNLVSDGRNVIMNDAGPLLAAALRNRGFTVQTVSTNQLKLGGGGVRCTALALDPS